MYEQELKLTVADADTLSAVLNSDVIVQYAQNPEPQSQRFVAEYYDTKDRAFEKEQCSLRARLEGKKFRAAFKFCGQITDGMSQRQEYGCDIDGWLKNAAMLPDGELKFLVLNHIEESDKLLTIVRVDMQRRILDLDIEGTRIELVADQGVVIGNYREMELYEIELKSKNKLGDVRKIIQLGNTLQEKYKLNPSVLTKYQMGLVLWRSQ